MGKHMARNLLLANHDLTVYDIDSKVFDYFKEQSKLFFSRIKLILFEYLRTS